MKIQKRIVRSILVFLIFWNSVYLQLIPIKLLHLNVNNLSATSRVALSCFSNIILFFLFFFVYRKELKEDFKKFKNNLVENIDTGFKYWLIGLIIMVVTNHILAFFLASGGANNENTIQSMIKVFPFLMLIDGGMIAPFVEEIAFRKTLKDVISNKWIFVLLSFLIFGGAHVISGATVWTDYLYIISYGSLGAAFALAYYETDTIFTSMTLHMMHNTVLILMSIFIL